MNESDRNIADDSFLPSASLDALRQRAGLLRGVREFFDSRGFLEVETPILSADCVIDLHLDPLTCTLFDDPTQPAVGPTCYLQTSPEFSMKRLLAAGADAIYQVGKAFRGGERGPLHNPEFTMVEWYRVGDDMQAGMGLLADLALAMLPAQRVEFLTYQQAFQKHAGVDPQGAGLEELKAACEPADGSFAGDDRDEWLNLLLATRVEPNLGRGAPLILYHYPASQAALAKTVAKTEGDVAERFELYYQGIELANGYHELLSPEVLAERMRATNSRRVAAGKPSLPVTSRLEQAMRSGLPSCSGVALGFDRLAMLAIGCETITDVIAFPIDRA